MINYLMHFYERVACVRDRTVTTRWLAEQSLADNSRGMDGVCWTWPIRRKS